MTLVVVESDRVYLNLRRALSRLPAVCGQSPRRPPIFTLRIRHEENSLAPLVGQREVFTHGALIQVILLNIPFQDFANLGVRLKCDHSERRVPESAKERIETVICAHVYKGLRSFKQGLQ